MNCAMQQGCLTFPTRITYLCDSVIFSEVMISISLPTGYRISLGLHAGTNNRYETVVGNLLFANL
jgi:hypothetical protein